MRVQFLLGRAGSGKTTRCLQTIREELETCPDGAPLLLLAPKQATFQLERMLLEGGTLHGWTRLQILSFDRLASQILGQHAPLQLLTEEGRIMVLRGLLRRHQNELRLFRAAARLTGFAREVSSMLREFQQHRAGPERLRDAAQRLDPSQPLTLKLADLALLMDRYQAWLADRGLHDPDSLVALAAEALQQPGTPFSPTALWLDGFAEMTPHEIDLLQAAAARTERVTAAFCVDPLLSRDVSWSSPWTVVQQTLRRVHQALASHPGAMVETVILGASGEPHRFSSSPILAHLEQHWIQPHETPSNPSGAIEPLPVRCVAAADAEAEAEVAAREILRTVRAGARYRDIAVLARSLESHHAALERVFLRYEIPYFLDRRSPLSHHPLAELVRSSMRLAALDWQHEDWFGALKTGLTGLGEPLVDTLENDALAQGWDAAVWRAAPTENPPAALGSRTGPVAEVVLAFEHFIVGIGEEPDATTLTHGIRRLWDELKVHETLDDWISSEGDLASSGSFLHQTAREEISGWLDNVENAFARDPIPLAEWLPILDAGLASLTAGAIPPAQDQVLVGAIDRSRQPDLRLAILIGWNEGVFPAPPPATGLLHEADRELLASLPHALLGERLRLIGHERYFAYIAVTRPRERLLVTWSERDAHGRPLLPSPFVRHLLSLIPGLTVAHARDELGDDTEASAGADPCARLEHRCELLPWLLARPEPTPLDALAGDALRRAWLRRYREGPGHDRLHPAVARRLFGSTPTVSVSGFESFAACPFQFFVRHGLRAEERELFELERRHVGSLAHDILARFHDGIHADDLNWRDLAAAAARDRLESAASMALAEPKYAVFRATPESRWRTESLIARLTDLVVVLVAWSRRIAFQPAFAELAFGTVELPAWEITTPAGRTLRVRGKVDRLDTWIDPDGVTHFLVLDYKLNPPRLVDELIAAGIDLQLAAYALALPDRFPWRRHLGPDSAADETDEVTGLAPPTAECPDDSSPPNPRPMVAGMFYIPLAPRAARARNRAATPDDSHDERLKGFQHRGRFDATHVDLLDTTLGSEPAPSHRGAFAIVRNKDGTLRKGGDGRPHEAFHDLLQQARTALIQVGDRICDGHAEVRPYRHGSDTACSRCSLQSICRFDAWTQSFCRVRSLPEAAPASAS